MPRSVGRPATMMKVFALFGLASAAVAMPNGHTQTRSDSVRTPVGSVLSIERPFSVSRLELPANNSALPVANLSQLLSGRFAGVQVLSGGATGTGSRIRIRGQSSLLLGNEPLIVVDGVRLVQTLNASTQMPSRVDDINVDEIARIEIINGPSGTTMYGSEAAHGVINITTKRGVAGKTGFRAYAENGIVNDANRYPDLWSRWGKRPGSNVSQNCRTFETSQVICTLDSLSHGNIMHVDSLRPVDIGFRSQYGLQLSGGNQQFQYFVAGEREDETGVFKMPGRDQRRLEVKRGVKSLPEEQVRPSALARNTVRTNLSTQLGSKLRVDFSGGYVSSDGRLPPMSASGNGLGAAVQAGSWDLTLRTADGVPLAGYFFAPAGEIMSQVTASDHEHFVGGLSIDYTPRKWLTLRAAYGADRGTQIVSEFLRGSDGLYPEFPGVSLQRIYVRSALQTLDASGTFAFQPRRWLSTRTTVGLQRLNGRDSSSRFSGTPLDESPTTPSQWGSSDGWYNVDRNVGIFFEQKLLFHERVLAYAGARRDAVRAYDAAMKPVVYPTAGVSWLLAGREDVPRKFFVNSLLLRAFYGESGQFGKASDAITLAYLAMPGQGYRFPPGAMPTERKPEVSREWSSAVEASLFRNSTDINVSYFDKITRNVFLPLMSGPSLGGSSAMYSANAAKVRNSGVEYSLRSRFIDRRAISAEFYAVGATNRNRMISLRPDVPPVFAGNRAALKSTPGAPLFGLWSRGYTYNDLNGDNRITANEVTYGDSARYIASSIPTRSLAVSPRVELFSRKLRVSAQIDSKWGFRKFNNTLRHQCQSARSCRAVNEPGAPLDQQAAAIAASVGEHAGFFEDASFTRLREASIDIDLPSRFIRSLRGEAWSLALVGRNLGVITKYSGVDPESTIGTTDTDTDEYFNTPPMRYFTLRLNVKF